jgi:class 3 adenylate cyclase
MTDGYITINPGSANSQSVELIANSTLRIGRRPAAEGENKLVLNEPEVSGLHAEILDTNRGWIIRDLGSTNGTSLNGERLTSGREYILQSGDHIAIAQTVLLVHLPEDTARSADYEAGEATKLTINVINATILVGDLRNFTSLMEEYAENPGQVMQAAQQIFQFIRSEIRSNNGHLEKISGDAVMAYWHGDLDKAAEQAYKACQTALQLRSLLKTLARNKDYWPFEKFPLQFDIALATGAVAAGTLVYDESNASLLGDTANVAFRLEELIGQDMPGAILIDGSTYGLVQGSFDCDIMGEFPIKGRTRPVTAYKLLDYLRTNKQ